MLKGVYTMMRVPAGLPGNAIAKFKNVKFGLGTAPAHAENAADDCWKDFADAGKVVNYTNHPEPEKRLNFWSRPEIELDLARDAGAQVYRLGIDWGRLVPKDPRTFPGAALCGMRVIQDAKALAKYRDLLIQVKNRGMDPMVTMFHHSLPKWALDGGWPDSEVKDLFVSFCKDLIDELGGQVSSWVVINEPFVFSLLTYGVGYWPAARSAGNGLQKFGDFRKSINNMVQAHKEVYAYSHESSRHPRVPVGVAHFIASVVGAGGIPSKILAAYGRRRMNWRFLDKVADSTDFIGINYYGEERIRHWHLDIDLEAREYSENGKGIDPNAFFDLLLEVHDRYNKQGFGRGGADSGATLDPIPIKITENGVADNSDFIRPAFLVEHLLAVHAAIESGVPVTDYLFWTLTDNVEWSDGYGPKFGLVKRLTATSREKRSSYFLFKEIAEKHEITDKQREFAWDLKLSNEGKERDLFRSGDGATPIEEPRKMRISSLNWRFNRGDVRPV